MAVDSSGWMGKKWLLRIGFVPFLIKGKAVFHASGSRMQSQQPLAGCSRSANTTSLGSRLAMSYIYLSGYKDTTARQPAARLVTHPSNKAETLFDPNPIGCHARPGFLGETPGAYDHGGDSPSARCYPPSARVSVRRPRDDMHRARRPFIRMSVDLEVAHHGPETREHETVFFKGEIRQLPVQDPRVGIGVDIERVEVQEDADFLGDVAVAVGFVLPVAFVDDRALGQLSEPSDHLRAHTEGE